MRGERVFGWACGRGGCERISFVDEGLTIALFKDACLDPEGTTWPCLECAGCENQLRFFERWLVRCTEAVKAGCPGVTAKDLVEVREDLRRLYEEPPPPGPAGVLLAGPGSRGRARAQGQMVFRF